MPTILLIDDKPGLRQILAEELAFQGYTVMATGSVVSVDEIIRFSNLDLVIMDPYIKGQHRWDLLLDIKRQDLRLPVLIMIDFASSRRDPLSALAVGILVKGFELKDLLQKVAEVFQRKHPHPNREAGLVPKTPYVIRNQPGIDNPVIPVGADTKEGVNSSRCFL
jgi:DNA-binding NtrC family response regulator